MPEDLYVYYKWLNGPTRIIESNTWENLIFSENPGNSNSIYMQNI